MSVENAWTFGRDVKEVGRATTLRLSARNQTKECLKKNAKTGREQYIKPSEIVVHQYLQHQISATY